MKTKIVLMDQFARKHFVESQNRNIDETIEATVCFWALTSWIVIPRDLEGPTKI